MTLSDEFSGAFWIAFSRTRSIWFHTDHKVGDLIREAQTERLFSRSSDGLLISFFLYSIRLIVLHSRKIGAGYPIPVWCLKTDIFENRWRTCANTRSIKGKSVQSVRFSAIWTTKSVVNHRKRTEWTRWLDGKWTERTVSLIRSSLIGSPTLPVAEIQNIDVFPFKLIAFT